jgi:hypothetical protein
LSALCQVLDSAIGDPVDGLDRYASQEVLDEIASGGAGYNAPLTARDGACVTEAGDAEVVFTVEDRGEGGFYATTVTSRIVGDNALLGQQNERAPTPEASGTNAAATRTVADVCAGIEPIFGLGDGMAWRELDRFATLEVLQELRDLNDPSATLAAEGNTCVVTSENTGDAELLLIVGDGAEGRMALSVDSRLVGEAAYY